MTIPKEILEQLEFERVSSATPSAIPGVKKVKPLNPCEDCGVSVTKQRRVDIKLCSTGRLHWRGKCNICDRYNINNGPFDMTGEEYRRYVHDSVIMSGSRRKKYK